MYKTNLPILLLDSEITLPGGKVSFTVDTDSRKRAIKNSIGNFDSELVVMFQNDASSDINDCHNIGIYAQILSSETIDETTTEIKMLLMSRAKFNKIVEDKDSLVGEFEVEDLDVELTAEEINFYKSICEKVLDYGSDILTDQKVILVELDNNIIPSIVCDTIALLLNKNILNKIEFLDELSLYNRLKLLNEKLDELVIPIILDKDVEDKTSMEISKEQKEYYLRKKIKVIQEDLGDIDKATADADDLKEKIEAAGMPEDVKKQVLKELKRYKSTNTMSPESTMIRAYLDLMLELPWTKETEDNMDINAAKAKLDETHFGLEKVKDRILEYLSVKLYTGKNPQTILCLAGAPGVGKTTLAKSIAEALGRKFVKQSMGGVKDEAEVRGHRRTYIGALPGRIINGIKEAGVVNPVFLLDEIDKIGSDYKGDPSAALLEVLDPAQNVHFMDHYTEVEYDLSKVMFICTANYLENVPAPLRDRMEIIELSSYTELEKFQIAKNYVVKRSLEKNGLEPEKFIITDEAIKYLIKHYTREAGARQLERCMDSLVRKAIKKILSENCANVYVDEAQVTEMLGKKIYDYNESNKEDLVGCVNGLAWTAAGGDTLQIEVQLTKGKGNIQLTGKLGDVMKESAEVAYTWVKAHALDFNIDSKLFEEHDVHVHVPEGATPKDGPSAGVTLSTAIMSAFTKRAVHHDLAMTGEVTLTGRVLPIGGLKEKSIAAYRTGIKRILIPQDNIKDLEDIPQEVQDNLEIIPVSKISEVLNYALV